MLAESVPSGPEGPPGPPLEGSSRRYPLLLPTNVVKCRVDILEGEPDAGGAASDAALGSGSAALRHLDDNFMSSLQGSCGGAETQAASGRETEGLGYLARHC